MSLSSDEINLLIQSYLQEFGYSHAAFAFGVESKIPLKENISSRYIPPGSLVYLIQKGIMYSEIEAAAGNSVSAINHKYEEDLDDLKETQKQSLDLMRELIESSTILNCGLENQQSNSFQFYLNSQSSLVLEAHETAVMRQAWSNNSRYLATGDVEGKVFVWRFKDDKSEIFDNPDILNMKGDVTTLQWNSNDNLGVGDFKGNVIVFKGKDVLFQTNVFGLPIVDLKFNNEYLVIANNQGNVLLFKDNKKVNEWDLKDDISDVHWVSNNNILIGGNNKVYLLYPEINESNIIYQTESQLIQVAVNNDKTYYAIGEESGLVVVMDEKTNIIQKYNLHESSICSISWSNNNHSFITGGIDGFIKLVNIHETDTNLFDGHALSTYLVEYDPKERYIASVGADNVISIWSIETSQSLVKYTTEHPVNDIKWSPNGKFLSICLHSGLISILDFDLLV